jgi:hypothetical protein
MRALHSGRCARVSRWRGDAVVLVISSPRGKGGPWMSSPVLSSRRGPSGPGGTFWLGGQQFSRWWRRSRWPRHTGSSGHPGPTRHRGPGQHRNQRNVNHQYRNDRHCAPGAGTKRRRVGTSRRAGTRRWRVRPRERRRPGGTGVGRRGRRAQCLRPIPKLLHPRRPGAGRRRPRSARRCEPGSRGGGHQLLRPRSARP